jgi:hypothetical protein
MGKPTKVQKEAKARDDAARAKSKRLLARQEEGRRTTGDPGLITIPPLTREELIVVLEVVTPAQVPQARRKVHLGLAQDKLEAAARTFLGPQEGPQNEPATK